MSPQARMRIRARMSPHRSPHAESSCPLSLNRPAQQPGRLLRLRGVRRALAPHSSRSCAERARGLSTRVHRSTSEASSLSFPLPSTREPAPPGAFVPQTQSSRKTSCKGRYSRLLLRGRALLRLLWCALGGGPGRDGRKRKRERRDCQWAGGCEVARMRSEKGRTRREDEREWAGLSLSLFLSLSPLARVRRIDALEVV